MNDVSFFWIAFGAYLAAAFVLTAAAFRPKGEGLARLGRGLAWLGLAAHTVSIVWRSFAIGTEPASRFFERLAGAFAAGPAWQAAVYALLLVVAAAAVAVGIACRRTRFLWLPAVALAVVLEMILLDFLNFTRMPIDKTYEYLSFASWCSAIALLALSPTLRLVVMDAALAVAASLLTVFAAIQPKSVELQLVPALQSYWLFIHVSLTALAYAIFGIAFVVGALLLVKAYDPALVLPGTKRRLLLVGTLVKAACAALVLALVLGGLILPFRGVAYAPHETRGEATALPIGAIQIVRYGAALVGVFAVAALALFWTVYPMARKRDDRSGLGSFVFVVSSGALFAACLLLGGFTRAQERAIETLHRERRELDRVIGQVAPEEGGALTRQALDADIELWRSLSLQAKSILSKARWLPLTLDKQREVAADPVFKSLRDLFARAGVEWRAEVRYKDIKQIGRELGERADYTEAVGRRLNLPADRAQLQRVQASLEAEQNAREAKALLPRTPAGQIAAFVGIAVLLATPIGWALYFVLPRVRGRLPDVARLDRISYGCVLAGYPIFTFGALLAGAIWAHFAWGNWWSWDPKEVGSLIGWVLYTVYLHQRYREGLSPRSAALAAILGFLACTLSLAGNSFLGGLHAYS
ncbi:MAG TPA: cytochrome c biogenesis protein CcsA [Planctomycetota bacterium]|nr:cytochrome c biogenesis protein CcsA [Planctomycetota bacterium]HRR82587.1 cytochrome c biogenesis protein CcsA [Planctomycetota bacterium]HRT95053.1 cytochrome c biogenesis protein CcsA [Planctomycetota bacterium]